MSLLVVHTPAALPPDAAALLAEAEREEFQLGAAWFATVIAQALPPGADACLLIWRERGRAVALLPLRRGPDGQLAGLTSLYTTCFRPLVAADATAAELRRAGRGFARWCRRAGPLQLDALAADWPGRAPLLAGLRDAGVIALRFAHFANWRLDVTGRDWPTYLAGRPGELRETIRRRLARAGRDPSIVFRMVAGGEALEAAIAAYEQVHARSWKEPEPFPAFGPALLRAAAAAGVLRLGVLWRERVPVAARSWLRAGGTATVLKLAHDEAAKAISPGTVLTALMIRQLLQEGVTALDFGRGDDPYKAGWTGERRLREGLLLCPLTHPAGVVALARQLLGRALRGGARRA